LWRQAGRSPYQSAKRSLSKSGGYAQNTLDTLPQIRGNLPQIWGSHAAGPDKSPAITPNTGQSGQFCRTHCPKYGELYNLPRGGSLSLSLISAVVTASPAAKRPDRTPNRS
jgi:hypothetical protein